MLSIPASSGREQISGLYKIILGFRNLVYQWALCLSGEWAPQAYVDRRTCCGGKVYRLYDESDLLEMPEEQPEVSRESFNRFALKVIIAIAVCIVGIEATIIVMKTTIVFIRFWCFYFIGILVS